MPLQPMKIISSGPELAAIDVASVIFSPVSQKRATSLTDSDSSQPELSTSTSTVPAQSELRELEDEGEVSLLWLCLF